MAAADRPNLLFVFADQLRARELDDPAHPLVTPAYDRLREEGTRCVNAVANCPVCTPSRAMLLTGQYPLTNRVPVNDIPLPEDAVTFGDVLQREGYRTGYIGKWHLDGVPRSKFTPPGPRRHGFDTWAVHNCIHDYLNSCYYRDDPTPIPIRGYEPEFQTDLAIEFLEQPSDDPFCLVLSWGPPHDPYPQVPEWFQRLYDPERIDYPPNFGPPDPSLDPNYGPFRWDRRRSLCCYYAHVTALDLQLMRLLETLDRTGQAERTIVVYTSDHGDMLWSHGRVMKQQPWDESVRIPFVIRWPEAVPAGRDEPVCLGIVDLAPTLLSLLGVEAPETMQGTDLAAVLRGESSEGPRSSFLMDIFAVDQGFAMGVNEWRGVRTQRHTYACWRDGACWVLYDNLADPYQLTNLARVPGHEALLDDLSRELSEWLVRTDDPFAPGLEVLRELDLVPLWNARERELHGDRGRFLEER